MLLVWYVKQAVPPGLAVMLESRICDAVAAAFAAAFQAREFR
jgi:hypothetical protein